MSERQGKMLTEELRFDLDGSAWPPLACGRAWLRAHLRNGNEQWRFEKNLNGSLRPHQ